MASRTHRGGIGQYYNETTDVLTLDLGKAEDVTSDDTPSGFVVYYSLPSYEPVSVEILGYCARFGASARTLTVDADEPFHVSIEAVECGAPEEADPSAFRSMLRTARTRVRASSG